MTGGHLLIVTLLGLLALTEGGHLFGKGLVKGAFKSLFKSARKEPQHCEIKWEDVWKPHCTTTYEKVKLKLTLTGATLSMCGARTSRGSEVFFNPKFVRNSE